jgi:fused signal recognition particle receptor
MFDGLKEKLNSFRKDVEETAEEKAAEQAQAEAEAEADADADVDADTDPAAEPEPESEPEPELESEPDATPETPEQETPPAEPGASGAATADAGTTGGKPDAPDPGAGADGEAGAEPTDATAEVSPEGDDGADAAAVEGPTRADDDAVDTDELTASEIRESPGAEVIEPEEAPRKKGGGMFQQAKAFATGRIIIEEEDLEDPLWELEMALLESDVEMNVAEAILETIREKLIGESRRQVDTTAELVSEALHDALLEVISVGQFDFDARVEQLVAEDAPAVIIFTGVNGVGKTTSIAKLSQYFERRGLSTVLANGDTYRAGANEQIREHARRLDRKLIAHEQGGDPAAVLYDAVEYAEANDVDVVLGDTAGRLHTSKDLMEQLGKIDRVVDPDMTLFVDEAVAGQDAVERAKKFDEAASIDGSILTKADADSQGGAAISIAYVTGKPILFLGTGQEYHHLERFDPETLVDRLLGETDG